jgi:hypothetical protein
VLGFRSHASSPVCLTDYSAGEDGGYGDEASADSTLLRFGQVEGFPWAVEAAGEN